MSHRSYLMCLGMMVRVQITRNDVLRRDLNDIVLKHDTDGCVVQSGIRARSPYSGEDVSFDQQEDNSLDIDHVVALSDAWQTGAAQWEDSTRREFANDPLNLLAVEDHLNQQKGDGDAATWLPPNISYRCEYVSRQIAVKAKYGLWVKTAEKDAMEQILGDCEGFAAFADDESTPDRWEGDGAREAVAPAPEPEPEPEPQPHPEPTAAPEESASEGGGSVFYQNCDAVRAAGTDPIHIGDPGYSRKLDRDGDGVGCE